jgi:phosphonate transport system substrate-binding protein
LIQRLLFLLAAVSLLTACLPGADPPDRGQGPVRIGVLPDQSSEELSLRFDGLARHLEKETGLPFEVKIADDYNALLSGFIDGEFDLALFGGFTYVKAEDAGHAEPLVMRDTDMNFRSCYVVKADDERTSIRQFEDSSILFGPRLSTSGHLMPRLFLRDESIVPEGFFSRVGHSAGHDRTALRVASGEFEIGVMNCLILDLMFEQDMLSKQDIRLLHSTPTYTDYVWAAQRNLEREIQVLITDAFLALDAMNPEHISLLRSLGANAYLPASRADFDRVRQAAAAFPIDP